MDRKELVIFRGKNQFCENYAREKNAEMLILENSNKDRWIDIIKEKLKSGKYWPVTDITTNAATKVAFKNDVQCLYGSLALGKPKFKRLYIKKIMLLKQKFPKAVVLENKISDHFFPEYEGNKDKDLCKIFASVGFEVKRERDIDWKDEQLVVIMDHHAEYLFSPYTTKEKRVKTVRGCPCCIMLEVD
jgi:hypothetical protein